MMSNRRAARRLIVCAVLAATGGVPMGCGVPASRVELVSYSDPQAPQSYHVDFETCGYRIAGGDDLHIAGRTHPVPQSTGDDAVSEYLHVHLYWKPNPGKTFANSSTTNATLRYVVATADGAAVYAGTGFAYPKQRRDGRLQVNIESARLHLESSRGDVPDFLGNAKLTGTLVAADDAHTTAQIVREIELLAAR